MKGRKGMYVILVIGLSLLLVGSCAKVEEVESSSEKEEVARTKPQTKGRGEPSPEKEEARVKILARVNGVAIREKDLMLLAGPGMGPGQIESLLGEAINQELLYQEAKRMGLDRDKDYLQSLEEEQGERPVLAAFYEDKSLSLELGKSPDPRIIPEKEVEEYYQKHKSYYDGMELDEKDARPAIRYLMIGYWPARVRQEWVKKIFRKAKIKVNGESISSQVLVDSLPPSPAVPPPGSRWGGE